MVRLAVNGDFTEPAAVVGDVGRRHLDDAVQADLDVVLAGNQRFDVAADADFGVGALADVEGVGAGVGLGLARRREPEQVVARFRDLDAVVGVVGLDGQVTRVVRRAGGVLREGVEPHGVGRQRLERRGVRRFDPAVRVQWHWFDSPPRWALCENEKGPARGTKPR